MVGSAIIRKLRETGHQNIITKTHNELDLTDQTAVSSFFKNQAIEYVILAAAKVGGIHANNSFPADFIYQNTMIQSNVIHQAYLTGIEKLLFLGSSCIYPKLAPQPMNEEALLTGTLESTNEPYAIAKISGVKMCESYNRQYGTQYRSVMPTNLYGPCDNYHLENSHVLPALIRKFHLAKLAMQGDLDGIRKDEESFGFIPKDVKEAIGVDRQFVSLSPISKKAQCVVWGTGQVKREFLHVDDMAAACIFIMGLGQEKFGINCPSFLNVGTGLDISIFEVAKMVGQVVGFEGDIVFNSEKPDGTPKKLLDVSRLNSLGWSYRLSLREGLQDAYNWYCAQSKK